MERARASRLTPIVAGSACCLLALWLGLLHGYYPARRLRTIAACVVLVGVLWLGRRWLGGARIRVALVVALTFAAFGTLGGSEMQVSNSFIEGKAQQSGVRQRHHISTQCLAGVLPPCRENIVPIDRFSSYELETICFVPYFLCPVREAHIFR